MSPPPVAVGGRFRRPPSLWAAYLVAVVAGSAGFFLLPDGGIAQGSLFVLVSATLPVAMLVCLRRHRPGRRRAWSLLLLGQVINLAANLGF